MPKHIKSQNCLSKMKDKHAIIARIIAIIYKLKGLSTFLSHANPIKIRAGILTIP